MAIAAIAKIVFSETDLASFSERIEFPGSRCAPGKLSGQRTIREIRSMRMSLNIDVTQSRRRVIRIAYLRDVRARAKCMQQPADAENAGDSSGYSKPALMSLRDRVT